MKIRIKAHPFYIAEKFKPFLFVLVLPLVKGLLQYLIFNKVSGVLALEIGALFIIFFVAILKFCGFSVELQEEIIIIKIGFLIKKVSYIDKRKASSLSIKENPIEKLFGAVTIKINTEAGKRKKADFKFSIRKKDALILWKAIYGDDSYETEKISNLKIAVWAATTSTAFSGLLIAVPIINKIGDLLGIALSDMLFAEIESVSKNFNIYMPPVVNTVTLIFLFAYGVGFLFNFIKNIRFTVKVGNSTVNVNSGVISKHRQVFRILAVNNICIEQTFFMRLVDRCAMYASVGGFGTSRSEKAVVSPFGKREELIKGFSAVFSFLDCQKEKVLRPKRDKKTFRRFLKIPIAIGIINICLTIIVVAVFPYFDKLLGFTSAVLLGIIFYWATLCSYNYLNGRIILENNILAVGSKGFKTRELYCKKENVGMIRLRQFPADRKLNTCKIKISINSEQADYIWVRNVEIKPLLKALKQNFNIENV